MVRSPEEANAKIDKIVADLGGPEKAMELGDPGPRGTYRGNQETESQFFGIDASTYSLWNANYASTAPVRETMEQTMAQAWGSIGRMARETMRELYPARVERVEPRIYHVPLSFYGARTLAEGPYEGLVSREYHVPLEVRPQTAADPPTDPTYLQQLVDAVRRTYSQRAYQNPWRLVI